MNYYLQRKLKKLYKLNYIFILTNIFISKLFYVVNIKIILLNKIN